MRALICGSVAFDVIMVFQDRFTNHILPEKVHKLNVSFLVPELRREFGGCAGNVSYNLKLLGGDGLALATVGEDFGPYGEWMDKHGIDRRYVRQVPGTYCAQAYITTDVDDNQITAFHPGAMGCSATVAVPTDAGITVGLLAPDSREGMLTHARQFHEAGIPFVFDPGQAMPLFDGPAFVDFIEKAQWVAVNDYECELLMARTGLSLVQIASRVQALIVTRGADGSTIHHQGRETVIPAAKARVVVDPTGCGDAYRAGLLFGLMHGLPWAVTGRIASLMGAIKIEQPGTQNHVFSREEFCSRYEESFGETLSLPV